MIWGGRIFSLFLCVIMGNRWYLFQWFMHCNWISWVPLHPKPFCCSCCLCHRGEKKVDPITSEIFKWKGISFQDRLMAFGSIVLLHSSRGYIHSFSLCDRTPLSCVTQGPEGWNWFGSSLLLQSHCWYSSVCRVLPVVKPDGMPAQVRWLFRVSRLCDSRTLHSQIPY